MWTKTPSGSVFNDENEPVFLSIDDFKSRICFGSGCFVCGKSKNDLNPFNDEHVVPNWLLKKYQLHDTTLSLPNGNKVKYSTYKIRCCITCNSALGKHFEIPISRLIDQVGYDGLDSLKTDDRYLLYKWLGLIYLKVHLRDKFNRLHLDVREKRLAIAEEYNWNDFHHVHQMVFSELRGTKMHPCVKGTLFALKCSADYWTKGFFDYLDLHHGSAMMIKIGNTALFAVLDDGKLCQHFLEKSLAKIIYGLNRFQCIEVLSTLAFVRCQLSPQPVFSTITNRHNKTSAINCEMPARVGLDNIDVKVRGSFMAAMIGEHMKRFPVKVQNLIKEGELSFLFNSDGELINEKT